MRNEVLKIKEALAKTIKIQDGGIAELQEADIVEFLPEGLTTGQIRAAQTFISDVAAGAAMAFGDHAATYMKKHKETDSVSLSVPVGKANISVGIQRYKDWPDLRNPGQKTRVHGQAVINVRTKATVSEKMIKDHIKASCACLAD